MRPRPRRAGARGGGGGRGRGGTVRRVLRHLQHRRSRSPRAGPRQSGRAGSYLRELPQRLISLGINDPGSPRGPTRSRRSRLGELEPALAYLEHYEAHARHSKNPAATAAAARCRGLLAAKQGDLVGAVAAVEFPGRAGRLRLPVRAPDTARPRNDPATGTAEGAGPRGARTGPGHLRERRRPAVGGQGRKRAGPDQRPPPRRNAADRTEHPSCSTGRQSGVPTRRSPPSCTWA